MNLRIGIVGVDRSFGIVGFEVGSRVALERRCNSLLSGRGLVMFRFGGRGLVGGCWGGRNHRLEVGARRGRCIFDRRSFL